MLFPVSFHHSDPKNELFQLSGGIMVSGFPSSQKISRSSPASVGLDQGRHFGILLTK